MALLAPEEAQLRIDRPSRDSDALLGDLTLCAPRGSRAARRLRAALRASGVAFHGAIISRDLDRSAVGNAVLLAPDTEYLLILDGDLTEDTDHAVDLLASLVRSPVDVAVSRADAGADYDGLAARRGVWQKIEGTFVGIERILEDGSWTAGAALTRNTSDIGYTVQPLGSHGTLTADEPPVGLVAKGPALLAGLALAAQALFILGSSKSPFTDEGIYLVMGRRAMGGDVGDDGFLDWVTGSVLYPLFAGAATVVGGLDLARLLSAVLIVGIALVSGRAARHLDHATAELPTVAAVLISGPLIWFGHQVNHDLGVLAGLTAAVWCVSRYHVNQRRSRLVWAGFAAAAAVLSAYAGVFMLAPLTLLVMQVVGWRQWRRTLPFFAAVLAPLIAYAVANLGHLRALQETLDRLAPGLVTPRAKVAVLLLAMGAVVAVLVILGVGRSTMAVPTRLILGGALFVLPAIHLANATEQAGIRHAAYGIPLAAPLMGRGLQRLWGSGRWWRVTAVTAVLVPVGVGQAVLLDRDWVDLTPTLEYLDANVSPGDELLTEHQWPVTSHLLHARVISNPWVIYSEDRIGYEGTAPDYCTLDWFVEDSSEPASALSREKIDACGTFTPVFTHTAQKTQLSDDLHLTEMAATITVWQNLDES